MPNLLAGKKQNDPGGKLLEIWQPAPKNGVSNCRSFDLRSILDAKEKPPTKNRFMTLNSGENCYDAINSAENTAEANHAAAIDLSQPEPDRLDWAEKMR
jgi:hypothetical protein